MNTDREAQAWQECPPGELKGMVAQIRVGQRREFLRTLAKSSAAVILFGAGGVVAGRWMLKEQSQGNQQLACRQVVELLPEYVAHRLDANLTQKVAAHLAKCPPCRAHYEEMVA
jgi:hypothetical protein